MPEPELRDVYVAEAGGAGINRYVVMVDGKVYDELISSTGPLTSAQQGDVAAGYRDALTGYTGGH